MDEKLRQLDDGPYELRFERRLGHAQEKVWRAITDPAQLRAWFVEILDYDRSRLDFAAGAELAFAPEQGHDLPPGKGRSTRFDPPNLLVHTWDADVLRWELAADGPDGCRLIFTNIRADHDFAILELKSSILGGRVLQSHHRLRHPHIARPLTINTTAKLHGLGTSAPSSAGRRGRCRRSGRGRS